MKKLLPTYFWRIFDFRSHAAQLSSNLQDITFYNSNEKQKVVTPKSKFFSDFLLLRKVFPQSRIGDKK